METGPLLRNAANVSANWTSSAETFVVGSVLDFVSPLLLFEHLFSGFGCILTFYIRTVAMMRNHGNSIGFPTSWLASEKLEY